MKDETDVQVGDEFDVRISVSVVLNSEVARVRVSPGAPGLTDCVDVYLKSLLAGKRLERPLAVGDRVRTRTGPWRGKIVAIDGDAAWMLADDKSHTTFLLTDLVRL